MIVALGRRIATTRPTGIRCTMGMQRHAGGGNALRLLYALPGVTGDWQYPGGGASYSTSGRFVANVDGYVRDDLLQAPVRTLSMTRLGEALLSLDDPPVKALVVYGANPMSSNPDQARVREGLSREDLFTVVIEQFPTDTVDYADIVLPSTMQTEHLDVNDGYGHMYVSLNRPAVAAPGECLPATETFRRLARAMELDEPLLYEDDETLRARCSATRTSSGCGVTAGRGSTTRRPSSRSPTASRRPSGKLEFHSERARDDGHDPLPGYVPPALTGDAPLSLIAPASHWFLNSMFANKPDLMKRAGEPRIELIAEDAIERGIETGDEVRVFNARGASSPTAEISDRVRPGVIASTKGHWLKNVRGGANVNATVEERDADLGGGAIFHDNRVEVERVRQEGAGRSGRHRRRDHSLPGGVSGRRAAPRRPRRARTGRRGPTRDPRRESPCARARPAAA